MENFFTETFDVAQMTLYLFWIFFFGLILYLHRESKREGFPSDGEVDAELHKFPLNIFQLFTSPDDMPDSREYKLPHGGGTRVVPGPQQNEEYEVKAQPMSDEPGAPLEPTGNPMTDGVGPAAYAIRPEVPDMTIDGRPRIVPLRVASDHSLESNDPDPRGKQVFGADGIAAGTVKDAWIDRSEPHVRYLELSVQGQSVMLPMPFAKVDGETGEVNVASILASQFSGVPSIANPDQITLQEEDKVSAYYGGGTLYATPERSEPIL